MNGYGSRNRILVSFFCQARPLLAMNRTGGLTLKAKA
jgi:hypothetical protein